MLVIASSMSRSVGLGFLLRRAAAAMICTEQAPHCATPQPYLVPVRPACSRMTQSSGVSASTCTSRTRPLMLSFAMGPSRRDANRFSGPSSECARLNRVARDTSTLPPDGAIREYAPDARWKERFAQLAADASCIVIAFGESQNLEWELAEIRQRGMS